MEPPSPLNMSAYTQFGYPYPTASQQLLVSQSGAGGNTTSSGGGCCEGGRTIMTDPGSGQPICSCQYDRLALGSYSRLGSGLAASGGVYGSTYPPSEQSPYPSIGVDSSAFYSPLGSAYSVKDGATGDMSMYGSGLGASPAGYYPYDPTFAAYGYGAGYDLASRRKNATRESTATLKAWLNEHKKNPYPTKGEKIMLAIITKMTLTQVSTWFANARRRLKKENKMTWEPRNKTDDDDAKLSDDDDDEKEAADKDDDEIKKDDKDGDSQMTETKVEEGQTELKSCDGGAPTKGITAALSPAPPHHNPFAPAKGEKSDSDDSVQLHYKRHYHCDGYDLHDHINGNHLHNNNNNSNTTNNNTNNHNNIHRALQQYSLPFDPHGMNRNLHDFHHGLPQPPLTVDDMHHHNTSAADLLHHAGVHHHSHHHQLLHHNNHIQSQHMDDHLDSSNPLDDGEDDDNDDNDDDDDTQLKRHALYSSKPKIWSLADTAACKTPPPPAAADSSSGNVWLAGSTTFPLPPTIPPTMPPSSQYPRFSHPMPGAIPSQYMANSYSAPLYTPSEGVGTDTPPQTPPNAKGSNSQSGSQVGLLGGSAAAYMQGNSGTGPSGGYGGLGGPLSCTRNPPPGLPMQGQQGSDVSMNPAASQRYPGTSGLPLGLSNHNNNNVASMVSTAFTPVYKTPPQQQSSQQQVSSSQQQQQHHQQLAAQGGNILNTPSSVGSLAPSSYVT